MDFDNNANCSW